MQYLRAWRNAQLSALWPGSRGWVWGCSPPNDGGRCREAKTNTEGSSGNGVKAWDSRVSRRRDQVARPRASAMSGGQMGPGPLCPWCSPCRNKKEGKEKGAAAGGSWFCRVHVLSRSRLCSTARPRDLCTTQVDKMTSSPGMCAYRGDFRETRREEEA